ncbi:MAG: hypothetical protein ACXWYU_10285 [Actinomycetota bacterium]
MERPMDDTEQASRDQADETARKKAAAVEAYESEWYEVLKRRAAELEEDGDAGEAEQDDQG